jgi:hypothetical protein
MRVRWLAVRAAAGLRLDVVQAIEKNALPLLELIFRNLASLQARIKMPQLDNDLLTDCSAFARHCPIHLPGYPEQEFSWSSTTSSIRNISHSRATGCRSNSTKLCGGQGPVVVEGEVVIEALGSLEHTTLELRLAVPVNQAGEIHYLAFVAGLVVFDFRAAARQCLFDAAGKGITLFLEEPFEHPSKFDAFASLSLAAPTEEAVALGPQLRLVLDEELELLGTSQVTRSPISTLPRTRLSWCTRSARFRESNVRTPLSLSAMVPKRTGRTALDRAMSQFKISR